ncbi:PucR family transcriptional regulator [Kribbella antibiotica]|uniref:PucR family transcriptional regulator n=1 Tax=Kribbella antibiotica TaxID=190195 RepID=A0A4R4YX96_9ACTN|nr:PucR family transcriptional regulator [Kribbella antibiotica]
MHELLRSRLPRLVDDVLARLVAEIPLYAQLPSEELQGDIRRITDQSLRAFIEAFRTGVVPTGDVLAPLRESARRRAEEGVPLEALLAAYHLGGKVCADGVAIGFRPDELADAIMLNRLILDFLQQVTAVVSASYFEERQSIAGEVQATRQAVLAALLDGRAVDETALRAGTRLPAEFVVAGMAFGAHPDEHQPGVDPQIVARRKLRRIRVELERLDGSMASLSVDGGIALLSAKEGEVENLRTRLSRVAGVDVTLAITTSAPAAVPAAAALVRDLLDVIRIHRHPPGVYELDDLVLEFQLSRPGPARDRLAQLLEPLEDRADLLSTLRCYLANARGRRQTAADLHLHANTVDYRLKQVAKLTGLDPGSDDQLPRIVAALVAFDAQRSPL